MARVLILGVGNILRQDEGFGVHFINEMNKLSLPPDVELIEGGTAGLELLYLIEGVDHLIIVDSVAADAEPGAIFKFKPNDISVLPPEFNASMHQIGLFDVLKVAMLMDKLPDTTIFGIQPQEIGWGMEMTSPLQGVMPKVIDLVMEEVKTVIN